MPAMPSLSPSRAGARPAARAIRSLAALALAGLVAACGGSSGDQFAPQCPGLSLVPDAGDLTRFTGGGRDVTNLLVRARITKVPATCKAGDSGQVRATLHVEASLIRGPAAPPVMPPIGYFIALTEGGKVLEEKDFALTASFAPNDDYANAHGDDIELILPVSKAQSAAAYQIYVGFRLTPEELAYNRSHRRP